MIIKSIKDLPYRNEQAVIINVGTKHVTTLALLSVLKYVKIPILIIDSIGGNIKGDFNYFVNLQANYKFDLIQLPLRAHGKMLDFIFSEITADYVLIIDSDIEILNEEAIQFMRKHILSPNVFGTGFIHGPVSGVVNKRNSYYIERMWIPYTLLNVKMIKLALLNNISFNILKIYNDFPYNQWISKMIYKISNKLIMDFKILNLFRKKYCKSYPSYVLHDTGAEIYQYLKNNNYYFIGFNVMVSNFYTKHYHGITRNLLDNSDFTGNSIDDIITEVKTRLKELYNFNEFE